jgi:hypothetical protein
MEEWLMTWTRRWGIIGSIALAQLGIIVAYQALLTGDTPAASAGQVVPPKTAEASQVSQTTPPIQLPPLPAAPIMPGEPTYQPPQPPGGGPVVPVSGQEGGPLPVLIQAVPPPGPDGPGSPQPFPGSPQPFPGSPQLPRSPAIVPAPAPAANAAGSPWNLSVEIIDGRTHLTAHNGQDVKFTVSCQKLDVQSPQGRIEASGNVKVTSANLEGTCDRLTISWQEDVVVLEKVQLKCKLQGQAAEVIADQLRLRLDHAATVEQLVVPPNEK